MVDTYVSIMEMMVKQSSQNEKIITLLQQTVDQQNSIVKYLDAMLAQLKLPPGK